MKCDGQSGTGARFLRRPRLSRAIYHSTNVSEQRSFGYRKALERETTTSEQESGMIG